MKVLEKNFWFLGFVSFLILLLACGKDDDNNDFSDDVIGEPIVLTGIQDVPLVLEDVFANPNTPDYVLEGNWRLEAPVEVKPGVRILVRANAVININASGSFKAEGAADAPIYIEGEQDSKGFWRHISVGSNSLNNVLDYCIISNGGGGNTLASGNGTIRIESNSQIAITNTTIRQSDRYGIVASSGQGFGIAAFSNNTIHDCTSYPVSLYINQISEIDETSEYYDNGFNLIEVKSQTIEGNLSIQKASVPYLINGNSNVNAFLEINEGTTINMGPQARLTIGNAGSLAISGTASNRVTITGNENVPGYWDYIYYNGSNSNNNYVKYADISYGGGSSLNCCSGMISLDNALFNLEESSLNNSARFGLKIRGNTTFNDLGGNTFSNNASGDIDE